MKAQWHIVHLRAACKRAQVSFRCHIMPVRAVCNAGAMQVKDRAIVAERMKAHVQAPDTTPLLIFPEGTCVNNEYCVMFKRGAFDLGATVCPVAIKYNKIFVDAFWNSKRQSFTAHLVRSACFACLVCTLRTASQL